jgi:hypothetical protein
VSRPNILIIKICREILTLSKLFESENDKKVLTFGEILTRNMQKSDPNPGGLDLSRRDLDRDLDLDAKKVSVSTVEKISTVSKS